MKLFLACTILMLSSLFTVSVWADNVRHIHLNNQHLSAEEILQLDQIVGSPVGDGDYWLNMQTGQWGYEGNPQVQGIIASIANYNQQSNQQLPAQQQQYDQQDSSDSYNDWEGVSGTGSVTSGKLDGRECTFISVGGTTVKSCD